jgi:hypothetical protein
MAVKIWIKRKPSNDLWGEKKDAAGAIDSLFDVAELHQQRYKWVRRLEKLGNGERGFSSGCGELTFTPPVRAYQAGATCSVAR